MQSLCAQGIRAIYGDASHIETLKVAGLEKTRNLILTASELSGAVELIRAARDANPKVHIVARTVRLETKKSLLDAGADRVFSRKARWLCRSPSASCNPSRNARTTGGEPRFDPKDSFSFEF